MRLNFSGVGEDDIREGVRRIGEVVREQVELLRHADRDAAAASSRAAEPAPARARRRARRRAAPARAASARRRATRARDDARRGPQGRPLAGAPGLAEVRRARAGRARAPRPRRRRRSTSATTSSRGCARSRPTSRSSRCTAATARTARSRSCSRSLGIPYTGSRRVGLHPLRRQGPRQAPHARRRASRRRTSSPSTRRRSRSSAPPTRCRRSRSGSTSRSSSSPPARARRWGSSSRARPQDVPGALVAAFSYGDKVLLERHVDGRDLAVSIARRGEALPVVEAVPREERLLRLRGALRDRPHDVRLPRRAARRGHRRARRSWRCDVWRRARLRGLRAHRPDARRRSGELYVLEANAIPGLTETSLLPQAADAAGSASTS